MKLYRVTVKFTPTSVGRRLWGHASNQTDARKLAREAAKEGHADPQVVTVLVPERLTVAEWVEVLDSDGMAHGPRGLARSISELAEVQA